MFRPVWSAEILAELARNLTSSGKADGNRVRELLDAAFEDARARGGRKFLAAVPAEVDAGDRHVVAAALAEQARVIVTFNLKDFPAAALRPLAIEVMHPDDFLVQSLATHPDATLRAVRDQAAQLRNPPLSLEALRMIVPQFAEFVAKLLPAT